MDNININSTFLFLFALPYIKSKEEISEKAPIHARNKVNDK